MGLFQSDEDLYGNVSHMTFRKYKIRSQMEHETRACTSNLLHFPLIPPHTNANMGRSPAVFLDHILLVVFVVTDSSMSGIASENEDWYG